ncbi:Acyltransferase 3 [hydrothermal vent metagenome]|uniref:Acyltransferase 3 n=1 Tax=hydrothermal vent metagenome TaxID=652676 RepID=A0A3B0ZY99_9ZZZZ
MKIHPTVSIYLDLVRFVAAVFVVFTHLRHEKFSGDLLNYGSTGNEAVMIFFVLSGFVVAYAVDTKDNTLRDFMLSRLARLYSVALPALILTVLLDQTGRLIDASVYDYEYYRADWPIIRFVANLFFSTEFWFVSIRPFSNGPFWSLGYEFWYYMIFGVAVFLKGRTRIILIAVMCIVLGPKILLLLPVWLLGVGMYHLTLHRDVPKALGWFLFIMSFVAILAYFELGVKATLDKLTEAILGKTLFDHLLWSKFFASSYLIAFAFAANLVGFHSIADSFTGFFKRLEKPIRYLASFTFTTYLMHFPLMLLLVALIPSAKESYSSLTFLFILMTIAIYITGIFTERKKHVAKNLLTKFFNRYNILGDSQSTNSSDLTSTPPLSSKSIQS